MGNDIEDMGANLMLRLFQWQIGILVKGIVRLVKLPFYLIKLVTGHGKGEQEKPEE